MTRHTGGNLEAGVQSAQAWSTGQALAGYAEHVYTPDDDPPVETNSIRAWRDWAGLRNGQLALRANNHRAPRVHALGWALDPENVWRPLRVDANGSLLVNTGPAPEPGPPTAQLSAWYRASDINQPDGSPVVAWSDLSGNGADLIQTVGLGAPTLVAGALGGQAVVRFDGFQSLNRANPPGYMSGDAAFSLYVVNTPDFSIPGATFIAFGWGTTFVNDARVALRWQKTGPQWGVYVDTYGAGGPYYEAALVPQIISASNTAGGNISSSDLRINGAVPPVLLAPGSGGPLAIASPVPDARMGGQPNNSSDRFRGDIAEVLVYHKQHNASERAAVISYLGARYGISVTP